MKSLVAHTRLLDDDLVVAVGLHSLGAAILIPGFVPAPALVLSDVPAPVQSVVMIAMVITIMAVIGADSDACRLGLRINGSNRDSSYGHSSGDQNRFQGISPCVGSAYQRQELFTVPRHSSRVLPNRNKAASL